MLTKSQLVRWCLIASVYVLLYWPCLIFAQAVDSNSARTFIEQGNRLTTRDEYAAAQESYRRALELGTRTGDTVAQASALLGLGEVYVLQVKFSHALEALRKSLALSEASGDTAGMARANNALGYVYYRLYYYDSAERHLSQALSQFAFIGDQGGMASVLNNMGRNHISQGHSPSHKARALDYYRRSIELGELSGNQEAVAGALNNLGNLYNFPQVAHPSISYYERALAKYEALGRRRRMGVVLANLARAYSYLEDNRRAVDYAERSIAILSRIEADDDLWEAYVNLGLAQIGMRRYEDGRLAFDEAIKIIERMRLSADGDELTLQRYFRGQTAPYRFQIVTLFQLRLGREALAYAEKAKARVLSDMLQREHVVNSAFVSKAPRAREQRLNEAITMLNGEFIRESHKKQPNQPRLAALRAKLQQARQDLLDFQAQSAIAQPESERARYEIPAITLTEAAALLPDEHSALLEYVITEAHIGLFVLTRGAPEHASPQRKEPEPMPKLPVVLNGRAPAVQIVETRITLDPPVVLKGYFIEGGSLETMERAEELRRQLAARDNNYRAAARELYDLLLRPAREQLRGKTSLVIMPDLFLWDLPFQALLDEENRHLIETAAVSYAPSLTVLREMKKVKRSGALNDPAGTLLALGNPALEQETITRARQRYRDARLEPLPEAEREVAAIGGLYGSQRSKVYTGAQAREQLLKEESGRYAMLHLATHAIVNNENPMYSALVLSQSGKQRNEDGLLEAWEIMKLNLRARMVVLSACETARGQVEHGEGMMGLSWAFFAAGVPTVVVSQWRVESASTTALMIEFHRQLQAPGRARRTTAEALRQAALKLLQRDRSLHPFYWAGFVVVGDGE